MAIASFGNKDTELFFTSGKIPKGAGWGQIKKVALRKLDMIHYAHKLLDLRSPPNNNLEKLKGNLREFYSIRINDQWRIIFKWTSEGPHNVKIIDYHRG